MIRKFLFEDADYRIVEVLDRQTNERFYYTDVKSKYLPFWIFIPFLWNFSYNTRDMNRAKEYIAAFRDFVANSRYTKISHKITFED